MNNLRDKAARSCERAYRHDGHDKALGHKLQQVGLEIFFAFDARLYRLEPPDALAVVLELGLHVVELGVDAGQPRVDADYYVGELLVHSQTSRGGVHSVAPSWTHDMPVARLNSAGSILRPAWAALTAMSRYSDGVVSSRSTN